MSGAQFWLNDPVFLIQSKKKPPAKEVVHKEASF
jgi:hypothetical protein